MTLSSCKMRESYARIACPNVQNAMHKLVTLRVRPLACVSEPVPPVYAHRRSAIATHPTGKGSAARSCACRRGMAHCITNHIEPCDDKRRPNKTPTARRLTRPSSGSLKASRWAKLTCPGWGQCSPGVGPKRAPNGHPKNPCRAAGLGWAFGVGEGITRKWSLASRLTTQAPSNQLIDPNAELASDAPRLVDGRSVPP